MRDGGSVVSLSYLAAERVIPGYGGGMSSAKAALEADTRTLAYEAGRRHGIRVNTISAGPLASRAAKAIGSIDRMVEYYEANAALPECNTADEVGTAAAFLLSPLASGITGETLHVDKGYHAMGMQAEDRLGQLDYDRRRAHGRWAEVVGSSAVGADAFARRCGLRAAAEREADALAPESRAVLDAFAAGVNAYLALEPSLPPDLDLVSLTPEPWRAADCCAVFLVRHVVFANWQKKLWRWRVAQALGFHCLESGAL